MENNRIYVEPKHVYDFVKRISFDPNPIHLKENPIVPGDLLVSLYMILTSGYTGEFYFERSIKAPTYIEIHNDGIYNEDRRCVRVQQSPLKETKDPVHGAKQYIFLPYEHIRKVAEYFHRNFDLSLRQEHAELLAIYSVQTHHISRKILSLFGIPKVALYTRHAIMSSPEEPMRISPDKTKIISLGKGKYITQVISYPYENSAIIKEVLVKI